MLSIEEEVGRGSSMNEKVNAMLGVKGLIDSFCLFGLDEPKQHH